MFRRIRISTVKRACGHRIYQRLLIGRKRASRRPRLVQHSTPPRFLKANFGPGIIYGWHVNVPASWIVPAESWVNTYRLVTYLDRDREVLGLWSIWTRMARSSSQTDVSFDNKGL